MRIRRVGPELTPELRMALELGPGFWGEDLADDDLALGWELHGAEILRDWDFRHASRPWAWWAHVVGEEPPPQEPGANEIRLAELGELTNDEYVAITERAKEAKAALASGVSAYTANGCDGPINFEQRAIHLYEQVTDVLERRARQRNPQ